ncbi:MAG TPA: hypothetical protein VFO10_26280 [Oligoflexus sp.]|uniref:hypothetical protein n=1 Tax=Oligoflexus sp. TaxID=1971216 RepID=UPI002D806C2A|nr:hypothetical protein [Oligoflexus sp.]HET9240800.1 hypothetical protein [Oligoflexus sp.]
MRDRRRRGNAGREDRLRSLLQRGRGWQMTTLLAFFPEFMNAIIVNLRLRVESCTWERMVMILTSDLPPCTEIKEA